MTGRYKDIQNVMASSGDIADITQYLDASVIERCYEILCFNLEAVIYLEQWADVDAFIRSASAIDSDYARSTMADMILTSEKMPIEHNLCNLQVSPCSFIKSSRLNLQQGTTQPPSTHRHQTSSLRQMHIRSMPTPPTKPYTRHTDLRDGSQPSPNHCPRRCIYRKHLSG